MISFLLSHPGVISGIVLAVLMIIFSNPDKGVREKWLYWTIGPILSGIFFALDFKSRARDAGDFAGGLFWLIVFMYAVYSGLYFRGRHKPPPPPPIPKGKLR